MKALETSLEEALRIVTALVTSADFSDMQRVRDILFEFRNDVKSQVLPAGSSFTALRAGSRISPVLAREELWKGIEQVLFLYRTADEVESLLPSICERLRELRDLVMNRNRLTLHITAERQAHIKATGILRAFVTGLPDFPIGETRFRLPDIGKNPMYETILVPSTVGYVSTAFPASSFMSPVHPHEVIVAQLLKTGFLWEQVRMKGGGVTASVNGAERLFSLSSYRDPRIEETLGAYQAGFERLSGGGVSRDELEKAVIAIVGRDLKPMSPGEQGIVGFRRRLYGITDELRQRKRDELLSSSPAEIRAAAEKLLGNLEAARSVVMTADEALAGLPERYAGFRENKISLV